MGVWIETWAASCLGTGVTSLLMWECGLKHHIRGNEGRHDGVTPYVGVWIETLTRFARHGRKTVTPYVGVWIETTLTAGALTLDTVTPYVGVWIETRPILPVYCCVRVTPYVGVWIETDISKSA